MDEQTPGIGDNSELTEEQKQSLFFHHRRLWKDALAKKKAADAAFKNACKRAKSEGVNPKMIKFSVEIEDDEDGKLAAEQEERERVAAWMGVPFGGQSDLFSRQPAVDKAFADGKRAGMEGKDCSPPYEPGGEVGQAWMSGWHEGQRALASTLDLFKDKGGDELIKTGHEPDAPTGADEFDDALEEF